jgi:hypothetical protein
MAVPPDKKFQNPSPQDLSLFTEPVDRIKIPAGTTIAYANDAIDRKVDYGKDGYAVDADGTIRIPIYPNNQDFSDFAGPNPNKKGTPEDIDYGEYTDNDFNGLIGSRDSETGAIPGLNTNKKPVKVLGSNDASNGNKTVTKPFTENLAPVPISDKPNELNQFSSVSYNIALYMMNSRSYVDITRSPNNPQEALQFPNSQLLMRSGGVGLDNTNNNFSNDFFIDDLEISNIAVGPNKFRHNTNATDIRFTITEPRGVTLLEKLQSLAGTVLVTTKEKYIHAPYLLEIKFKGYDETGKPVPTPSKPKYIPIRITNMTFEVTSSGTQYRVEAVPFSNQALQSIVSTIPHNIELTAKTVGDIFSSEVIKVVDEATKISDANQGIDGPGSVNATKIKRTKVKNLAEILTDSQKTRTGSPPLSGNAKTIILKNGKPYQVQPPAEKYDTYNFLIADEIANAKLNLGDLYDVLNTPVPTDGEKKNTKKTDRSQFETYVQGLTKGVKFDKDTGIFKINAGTDISKLINLVIMHSDYMDKNIEDNPDQYAKSGDPINWFRIRPVIKSATSSGGGYDAKEGRYKYDIMFAVEKNVIHYHDFPWAKKSRPIGKGYHKKYDYIFSGQNTQVLDFQLKFNTAFLQVMTAGTGSPFANKTAKTPFTPVQKEIVDSVEGNTTNVEDNITRKRAKDLFSSVMSDGVDMVNLDMQIVGDPAWIPTSDAYWQDKVRKGEQYAQAFMPDGTINYNLSPPFIQLNLKTPIDYDNTTGLQDPNQSINSSFSGVYRITQIDSTFSGGAFQQRLTGLRAPMQSVAGGVARDKKQNQGAERNTVIDEFSNDALKYLKKQAKDSRINNGTTAKVVNPEFNDYDVLT